jgi:Fe-S oxidoreductase
MSEPLKPFALSKEFLGARCDECGRCLHECPVLRLPLDEARHEIRALASGAASQVLERCTGCMACNTLCPADANPHTLILTRWRDRYRAEGAPLRARLVLPYQRPNLYTLVMAQLPEDEKALVRRWAQNLRDPPEADTLVYAGCNMLLQPFLLDSQLFAGVPIFGGTDVCCGEPLYRMGCWDAAQVVAVGVKEALGRMQGRRIITPCLACYHVLTQVYRDVFDVRVPVEVITLEDWLLERIRRGELRPRPLGMKVVVHDNCWPKAAGDALFDKTREILAALGVTAVDPPHARALALCCGMCAGAARFSLFDILRASRQRLRELEQTEADAVLDYCGGCNWLLGLAGRLTRPGRRRPLYHLLELVQLSLGEVPRRRTGARVNQILEALAGPLLARYLKPGRFWIDEIRGQPLSGARRGPG